MKIRTLDLFCGGGGSSWGARSAGAEIVCGVDAWDLAIKTWADNFPDGQAVNKCLHVRSNRRILGALNNVDLLLASPECTNHTCARGAREKSEESRSTANYVLNYAHAFKPRWIIIENVIHMRSWNGYIPFIQKLRKVYYLREQILNASDFGVPQNRKRLFIVCDRETPPPGLEDFSTGTTFYARDIIDPPGTWRRSPLFTDKRAEPTKNRARRAIETLGEGIPFMIVYYGSDGSGGWQRLDRPLRTITTLDRFGLVEWDSGEPTLRMLQVPELKRAMGFDDSFVLNRGSRRDRVKLLGNGVCPPVVKQIVKSLMNVN